MMLFAPIQHIDAIDRATLNRLLLAWGHRMGPYTRPQYALKAHHAMFEHGEPVAVVRVGKKAAGRLFDGVEHNGMPEARI